MRTLPLTPALFVPAALAGGCAPPATDVLDAWTDGGHFRVLLEPSPYPAVTGPNVLHLQVTDGEGRPAELPEVGLSAWMPAHVHASLEGTPADHDGGDHGLDTGGPTGATDPGHFHVGLTFTMPGVWEITVAIPETEGAETAHLSVDVR